MTTHTLSPQRITYSDLKKGMTIEDTNQRRWVVFSVEHTDQTKITIATEQSPTTPLHTFNRPLTDEITALLPPEFDQAKRDAEIKEREEKIDAAQQKYGNVPPPPAPPVTEHQAARNVTDTLGGQVVAVETAEAEHAREAADATGTPLDLPLWSQMTEPEMLTHLYLIHGVWGYDVTKQGELTELHEAAHQANQTITVHEHVEGLR